MLCCLTGLGLTLWYIRLEFEIYLNYLTGLGLILWYTGVRLEKYSDYLAGFRLILWYTGIGLVKAIGLTYWTQIDFIITNQGCC